LANNWGKNCATFILNRKTWRTLPFDGGKVGTDSHTGISRQKTTPATNKGIYASLAGHYKLSGRMSRRLYISINSSAASPTPA
jgi:hypothetical protein